MISRRKFLACRFGSDGGSGGNCCGGSVGASVWIDSAGWRWNLWAGRDVELCGAAIVCVACAGAGVFSQHDFEDAVSE